MVECTALEMRHTGNRIEGSNPSLSASNVLGQWEPLLLMGTRAEGGPQRFGFEAKWSLILPSSQCSPSMRRDPNGHR